MKIKSIREPGLRAWQINQAIWLCAVKQNKMIWFISHNGKSKVIPRKVAQEFLSLA